MCMGASRNSSYDKNENFEESQVSNLVVQQQLSSTSPASIAKIQHAMHLSEQLLLTPPRVRTCYRIGVDVGKF